MKIQIKGGKMIATEAKKFFLIKFNIIHDKNSSQIGKRKNFLN